MEVYQVIKNLITDLKGQIPDPDYCTLMFKIMHLAEENIRITLVENEAISPEGTVPSLDCVCVPGHQEFCCFDKLKGCRNFRILCEFCPFLNNLFEKTETIIFKEPIYQPYSKNIFNVNINSLLILFKKLGDERRMSIISVSLFNYCMQNMQALVDNQEAAEICLEKVREFSENEAFLTLLKEFNIDYHIWESNFEKIIF
jgi:hypothetical protein